MNLHQPLTRRSLAAGILAAAVAGAAGVRLPLATAAQGAIQPDGTVTIALGRDLMPKVPVSWRLLTNTAKPWDDAPELPRTLHFIMPTGQRPFTVANLTTGESASLGTGVPQAAFGAEGDVEKRYVESGGPAPYVAFELIVADADNPSTIGSGTWLGATGPFIAPAGRQQMELAALFVDAVDVVQPIPAVAGDYPLIGYVIGQPVTIVDASNRWISYQPGEGVVLEAGDTLRFAGADTSAASAALVFARFTSQRAF